MKVTLFQQMKLGPSPVSFFVCLIILICGCKSDVHHQLLERELRLQEDQIYCLQDKLQTQYYELDTLTEENASLRKQLGIVDDSSLRAPRYPRRHLLSHSLFRHKLMCQTLMEQVMARKVPVPFLVPTLHLGLVVKRAPTVCQSLARI